MSEQQTYWVRVPFAGYVDLSIDADTPQDALDRALEEWPELQVDPNTKAKVGEFSYEFHARLTQGNVNYIDCNEATVTDEDGDECDVDLGGW